MTASPSQETAALNAAIFDKLMADTPESRKAADAVNEFTRSLMYHKFTRMPKRGFLCRILPAIRLYPVTELERRGWPYDPSEVSEDGGVRYAANLWETGELYYEMLEDRLDAEDYELRLLLRLVPRWEWYSRERGRRSRERLKKTDPGRYAKYPTPDDKRRYFEGVMAQLASQVRRIAQGGNPG